MRSWILVLLLISVAGAQSPVAYSPPDKSFTVTFPGPPDTSQPKKVLYRDGRTILTVHWMEHPTGKLPKPGQGDQWLAAVADTMEQQLSLTDLQKNNGAVNGYPALQISGIGKVGKLQGPVNALIVLQGYRIYTLMAMGKSSVVTPFFGSFKPK